MFYSELIQDGHTKRLIITRNSGGWEICEEHDRHVVRTTRYSDWHRVERAKEIFVIENRLQPSTNL